MGIRTQVPAEQFKDVIPQFLDEIFAWLGKQGVEVAGAPFMRYHVINMPGIIDVEMGVPVASAMPGDGRISAGILPAGRYAALTYTGVEHEIQGNKALLDWGAQQGLVWDNWTTDAGDAFGARYESYITDPDNEPDPSKWETEVAIRLS